MGEIIGGASTGEAAPISEGAAVSNGKFWRQLDLVDPDRLNQFRFCVVGAGSIGSWTTLALAKMGARDIVVWDRDTVEEHNESVQVYAANDLGNHKVHALKSLVRRLTDMEITAIPDHLDCVMNWSPAPQTVLIMAVDNMAARQYLWERAVNDPHIRFVIDARSGGEVLRIYSVNPHDPAHEQFYRNNLYSVAESEQLPCSAHAVAYCSFFVAAFITSLVSSMINGDPVSNEVAFHCRKLKLILNEA